MILPLKNNTLRQLTIILLLVVSTTLAYWKTFDNKFLNFDDSGYVTKNEQVKSGLSWETVRWAFTSVKESNWHPLTWLSHALDVSLFGVDAKYHHATNLLLHLLSTILLFLAVERMTKAVWQSAFVAFMFALHPLHVESVAWVAERKDVLSGLFWMLTFLAYIQYHKTSRTQWYISSLIFFALGLLAKPMLVTLPFVLLLVDYWALNRFQLPFDVSPKEKKNNLAALQQCVKEKIPLFVLSIASSIVTFIVQKQGGSMAGTVDLSFSDKAANALVSYAQYIRKTFLPTDLAAMYPHPGSQLPLWQILVSLILLGAITAFVWRRRREHQYLLVGWLWFFGMLVPVIGLVQVGLQAMADRYMYLPMIGLSFMLAWGIPSLLQRWKFPRFVLPALFIVSSLLMFGGTFVQTSYWKDSKTLFERAIAVTKDNHLAHNNLGADLADSGKHAEALVHLREAYRLKLNGVLIRSNLARSLVALGERKEALEHYKFVLSQIGDDPALYSRIGDVLADEGRIAEAIVHFQKTLQMDSLDISTRCKLAKLYTQVSEMEKARTECSVILTHQPKNSLAHDILGTIAGSEGKYDEALKEFLIALELDSLNSEAYLDLGILYEKTGNIDGAFTAYENAIRINPQLMDAEYKLGTLFAQKGKPVEAELHFRRLVELEPGNNKNRIDLGRIYTINNKFEEAVLQFTVVLLADSHNILAHYHYANLLVKTGQIEKAKYHFSEAVRIEPSFQPAQVALQRLSE
ncbi:MAG: tetratricopeptide repeat protein [Ignavibacteriae bacterium]|nr:tetratricopeptide repeat protein [Ignavibacteriota bacterium]